jgi:hypothetical protein
MDEQDLLLRFEPVEQGRYGVEVEQVVRPDDRPEEARARFSIGERNEPAVRLG